jgi:Tol biopolymer transport system component
MRGFVSGSLVLAVFIPGFVFVSPPTDSVAKTKSEVACPKLVGHVPTTRRPRRAARRGDIVVVTERSGAPEISVLNAATGAQARLTDRTPGGSDTAWSPDGTMVAFDRHYYGYQPFSRHHELWVMRPDGRGARALIRNAGRSLLMPAWSPDCHKLAYVRGARELVIVDVRRGIQRTIARGKWLGTPTWAPDGKSVAFAQSPSPDFSYRVHHRSRIFIVGADGRGKRRLASGGMPAWSPKGNDLAYVLERRIPSRRQVVTEDELRLIRRDGRNGRRLTAPSRNRLIRDPAWSPDGRQLVVRRDSYGDGGDSGLVIISFDGSPERILLPVDYWEYAGHPAWSPSGDTITFDASPAIFAVDASGANQRLLRVGDRDSDPTWSPDRRSIAFHRSAGYASGPGPGYVSDDQGLELISSDARALRRVPVLGGGDGQHGDQPVWSPKGRWIAYMYGNAGIALHDMRTRRSRVLVCERASGADCDGRGVFSPAWTPSGDEVLFWGTLDFDPKTLSSRKVTGRPGRFARDTFCTGEHPDSEIAVDVSPDGRWLLFTASREIKSKHGVRSESEVWRIPAATCSGGRSSKQRPRARRLATGRDAVWSPDGKRVAFVKRVGGDDEIFVMKSDGSGQRALTRNVWDDEQPDW